MVPIYVFNCEQDPDSITTGCTHPLIFFFGFDSCANSLILKPWRYFSIHHKIYLCNAFLSSWNPREEEKPHLRSCTPTPLSFIVSLEAFQNSAQSPMSTLVSLERPIAFRKSAGVLILSVGEGIFSAGRRETKSVAKERRKICVIENGRILQHVRRLCMLRLRKRMQSDNRMEIGHVASYFSRTSGSSISL
jgi:hypothetical protein